MVNLSKRDIEIARSLGVLDSGIVQFISAYSEDNQKIFSDLCQHNILLFNQSVLLKGVNDDLETLVELSEKLIENQIVPYYLHLLDKVQGSRHFEVSDDRATLLYQQLRDKLPGYMLPRLVREIPGEKSKQPIS